MEEIAIILRWFTLPGDPGTCGAGNVLEIRQRIFAGGCVGRLRQLSLEREMVEGGCKAMHGSTCIKLRSPRATAAQKRSRAVGELHFEEVDPFAWFRDVLSRIAAHRSCRIAGFLFPSRLDSDKELVPLVMLARGTWPSAWEDLFQKTDPGDQLHLHPPAVRKRATAKPPV